MGPYKKGSKRVKPLSGKKSKKFKSHNFRGNQHTAEQDTTFTSTSAEKLKSNTDFDVKCDDSFNYCILLFPLVFSALANMLKCKTCDKDVVFSKTGIRGLGFKINISCDCGDRTINSCKLIDKSYEINRRIVFVMRLLGIGRHGLQLFCSLMDMTSGFYEVTYRTLLENVKIAVKAVADICLKKAGVEEKQKNKEQNLPEDKLTVSGDGTWCKRGFSSLIGVCTVIGKYTGKVMDYFVSSKVCKTCETMQKKLNSADFDIWFASEHKEECSANYEGSSGGMEVQGMIEIFKNSIIFHKAMYAYYIGDGDSKTFRNLLEAKPYGDFVIRKLECVLHVGKRMFRHLKDVKKTLTERKKFKKAEEKKKVEEEILEKKDQKSVKQPQKRRKANDLTPLPPPPKTATLTGKFMKKMSINYGLAIQRHPDSLDNMRNEIWAGFYHYISTDDAPQHQYCNEEWCKYLKAQKHKTPFKHEPALNSEVQELIKPVFDQLSNEELLTRCLGRNTQNNNECFNKTLWAIVPKQTFAGKSVVEIGVQVSLAIFNEGRMTLLKMMELMGCTIGPIAYNYVQRIDDLRISKADKASTAATKDARLARKEAQNESQREEETAMDSGILLYGPGIAD